MPLKEICRGKPLWLGLAAAVAIIAAYLCIFALSDGFSVLMCGILALASVTIVMMLTATGGRTKGMDHGEEE